MLCGASVLAACAALVEPALASALVATQPDPSPDVAPYFVADTDARWTGADWSS